MKATAKKIIPTKTSRGLGKGLSALMSESYSQTVNKEAANTDAPEAKNTLALSVIQPGRYQPRGFFDDSALGELADSIRKNGVMQPILVRPQEAGGYEIIAGERRYRAAKLAGLKEIPVLIRTISDQQALELALVENVQRQDLHPLEEAAGYQRLLDEFSYTQEELSSTVHKSRSHIANFLRLLTLPEDVRKLLSEDQLTMGHAKALLGATKPSELAQEIARRGLSVRQTEKLIRLDKNFAYGEVRPRKERKVAKPLTYEDAVALHMQGQSLRNVAKDPDILALEETLSENLGLKVSIDDRGQSGEITVKYESLEQLDEVLRRLGGSV